MDRPEPLTPADCDLRGMPYMELDIVRLLDSDFFAMTTGDEFKAGVALWGKSWNQVPAASLPTDDRILAHLAGVGRKDWPKVKDMALHGWIECADGRLYHPTVAEKALKAWGERRAYREDKSSEAERKAKERQDRSDMFAALRADGAVLAWNTKTSALRAEIAARGLKIAWTHGATVTSEEGDVSQQERDVSRDRSQPDTRTVTAKNERGRGNGTEEDIGSSASHISDARDPAPVAANDHAKPSNALVLSGEPAKPGRAKPKAEPTAAERADFDAFWSVYPRKAGKQPALLAYVAAVRSGTKPEDIFVGAQLYAALRSGQDPTHTKMAQGWLNDKRWADEIQEPPQGGYANQRPGAWDPMDQAIAGINFNEDFAA